MVTTGKVVLVTGSTGFIGKALVSELSRRGIGVVTDAGHRRGGRDEKSGDPHAGSDLRRQMEGIDAVIHLAGRAHILKEESADPLSEFRRVNVTGTEVLARQAADSGVRRFVFVSSIGVNGDRTHGRPFTELDPPHPRSDYARSKWEAEQALHRIAADTGLEVVILRPPLVYGAGAPGNIARLLGVLARGIPLPFASVENRRSLIYVGNLVDALILCTTHPAAAGQTYLASDGEDISTPQLLRVLGSATGHPARLFSVPVALLRLAGLIAGKSGHLERLLGSLQVDGARIRRELGWQPPFSLQQGLQDTGEHYRNTHP